MQQDCIFCNIVSGKISSAIVHQDDQCIAIRDINPQAPTHILVLPKDHIPTLNDLTPQQVPVISHLAQVAIGLAHKEGIASKGYRVAINCGEEGGQAVAHLHLHLIGGRNLSGSLG